MGKLDSALSAADGAKRLLAGPLQRIDLDVFVNQHLQKAMEALGLEQFPPTGLITNEEFARRVTAYEAAVQDLQAVVILLARWGGDDSLLLLEKILSRLAEVDKGNGGVVVWLRLGWYPLANLMYSAGIAALSARRYHALHAILATPVRSAQAVVGSGEMPIALPVLSSLVEIDDQFKRLSGHEQHRVPRSEHLFALLRPSLEEALFLGGSYERLFDRFELLQTLTFADLRAPAVEGDIWGPPGRFSWKHRQGESPLALLIAEAKEKGSAWLPLGSGFFGGQSERFLKVANSYKQLIDSTRW
jgi:hypothetical protein